MSDSRAVTGGCIELFEPTTGDEVLITLRQARVRLAVREEMGDWTAVELSPSVARKLAAALGTLLDAITPQFYV